MAPKQLMLLGPPGAGKGTQAKMLAERSGVSHLSTGDILRDEVSRGTALGKRAEETMKRGDLVSDKLVIDMIRDRVTSCDGFVLDGFPRTVAQAEALASFASLDLVINISLSREEVIRRLSARRICEGCGRISNLLFDPPEKAATCDRCGGRLIQRDDDQPSVIENRFDVYVASTAPLITHYGTQGILREVDGTRPPADVHQSIVALLAG